MYTGALLSVLGGACMGVCFLPMRHMKEAAWENTWFIWALFFLVVFPPIISFLAVPATAAVLSEVKGSTHLWVLAGGLVGGTSGILMGQGLRRIGMTLMNAIMNGVALIGGSLVPALISHRQALKGGMGLSLLAGLVLSTAGVVVCAMAASQQTGSSAYMKAEDQKAGRRSVVALVGVALAAGAGLFQALMSITVDRFSVEYAEVASRYSTWEPVASFPYFTLYFGASFVSNAVYCAHLWRKNGSLREFRAPGAMRFVLLSVVMAVVTIGGIFLWGWSLPLMSPYGAVVGWPIFLVATNLFAAVVECGYGDWKGKALRTLILGLALQTLSMVAFGWFSKIAMGGGAS